MRNGVTLSFVGEKDVRVAMKNRMSMELVYFYALVNRMLLSL